MSSPYLPIPSINFVVSLVAMSCMCCVLKYKIDGICREDRHKDDHESVLGDQECRNVLRATRSRVYLSEVYLHAMNDQPMSFANVRDEIVKHT